MGIFPTARKKVLLALDLEERIKARRHWSCVSGEEEKVPLGVFSEVVFFPLDEKEKK